MKGSVLIVCVLLAILDHGLADVHQECQADPATHIDLDQLRKSHGGEGVPNLSAHSLCMSKKLGFQKANGDIDKTVIRNEISTVVSGEAKINAAVEECGQQKTTPEETAKHIMRCFYEHGARLHNDHHQHVEGVHHHGHHH